MRQNVHGGCGDNLVKAESEIRFEPSPEEPIQLVEDKKSATLVEPTGESSSDFVAWLAIDSDHLAKTVPRPPGSQAAIGLVAAPFLSLRMRRKTADPA